MEDKDIPKTTVSMWQPITNKADLATLGKFGEEISEACTAIFRCLIQGMDGAEPETGKINKDWLEDEVADMLAMLGFLEDRFQLNTARIDARVKAKRDYKAPWFAELAKEDKSSMTNHEFLNRIRSLYNIDRDQLPELTEAQWIQFRNSPVRYVISTDRIQVEAILREVEKRQDKPELTP